MDENIKLEDDEGYSQFWLIYILMEMQADVKDVAAQADVIIVGNRGDSFNVVAAPHQAVVHFKWIVDSVVAGKMMPFDKYYVN